MTITAKETVITLAITLLLCACSNDNDKQMGEVKSGLGSDGQSHMQQLVRGVLFEADSLDPHKAMLQSGALEDLLEGLVVSQQDGSVMPGVAKSWSTTDGMTFKFNLRPEARWSNGDPVIAEDFVYAWRRAIDPATASGCVDYFTDFRVRNAGQISAGSKAPEELGIEAHGPHSLEVKLEQPNSYFTQVLNSMCFFPVHRATIEVHGEDWTRPENFVGNGAFTLANRLVGERIELHRNTTYWDADSVQLDKVSYLSLSNAAILNRYLAGDIDITASLPDDQFPLISKKLPGEIVWARPPGVFGFQVNTSRPPLDNPLVRRALAFALDRNTINTRVFNDGDPEAYTISPPELLSLPQKKPAWMHWTQKRREERALELLTMAGYSSDNPLRLQLNYVRSENNTKMALAASAMWKNVLGVETTLQAQEFKAMVERYRSADFDLINWAHGSNIREAGEIYASCCLNAGHYANEDLEKLLEAARITSDRRSRIDYYTQAETILSEDMPFIPVSHINKASLVNPRVKGIQKQYVRLPLSKDLRVLD